MLKLNLKDLKIYFIGGIRHMKDFIRNFIESPQLSVVSVERSLGEIVREGAEKLVKMAVMEEFEEFFSQYSPLTDQKGKQSIVRNGYHQERNVMTSAGNIRVKIPRLSDRRKGKGKEERLNFHSKMIPPYLRRANEMDDFIR
jgi:putative transposase